MPEKAAQKEPGKKPVPSKKPKPQQEVVVQIPLSELHPFPDHPFQVREDASMQETAESVKEYGVLVPALARPREDGGYELIAGHRRKHACELVGLATMPVIVRDIDRDAATIIMVDSNLQRENRILMPVVPTVRTRAASGENISPLAALHERQSSALLFSPVHHFSLSALMHRSMYRCDSSSLFPAK